MRITVRDGPLLRSQFLSDKLTFECGRPLAWGFPYLYFRFNQPITHCWS